MAVYILENRATAIEFVPPERPASATCSFKNAGSTELSAPAVTVDSTNLAIATATSSTEGALASGALVPARQYWWVSAARAGEEALVRCAGVVDASHGFTLEAPPPGNLLEVGDTFKGARLTATIPAVTERALNYRAEWTVTDDDGVVRTYQQAIHVVRCLFRAAVTADEASRYLAGAFPSMMVDRPFGYFAEVARRASLRVERKLLAGQRYQHLVGDYAAFVDAGLVALRIELALEGLVPPGYDPSSYVQRTDAELGDAIQEATAGLWYDTDDDGVVTSPEISGLYSMRLVRR